MLGQVVATAAATVLGLLTLLLVGLGRRRDAALTGLGVAGALLAGGSAGWAAGLGIPIALLFRGNGRRMLRGVQERARHNLEAARERFREWRGSMSGARGFGNVLWLGARLMILLFVGVWFLSRVSSLLDLLGRPL